MPFAKDTTDTLKKWRRDTKRTDRMSQASRQMALSAHLRPYGVIELRKVLAA